MKIGYLQYSPTYLDVKDNLAAVSDLLSGSDADLIVLPELFATGYFFKSEDDLAQVAEPIPDGPTTQQLKEWATALNTTLVAGIAERDGDTFYNSAAVVAPSEYVATYRKVHLYYKEKTVFAPGSDGFAVHTLTDRTGKRYCLGVMVCFDWYFPEAARTLALKGADIIAHPSNLVRPDCPRSMPIRALENHVFTITANRYGHETIGEETLTFIGQSEICDPNGKILVRAKPDGDAMDVVEIDPKAARDRQITPHNHILNDRRPAMYATE